MASDFETLLQRRIALRDAWVLKRREIARMQAEAAALLAARWELFEDEIAAEPMHARTIERSMMAEYSAAGHVSKGSMEFAFTDARMLHESFPAILGAFQSGAITPGHVREILKESQPVRAAADAGAVAAETLGLYEQAVLEVAEHDTAARTRSHARQIAAALAGMTVVEQQKQALSERSVTVRSVGDGLALLQAVLPEHLAVAIHDRLTKMARHLAGHPEDRDPVIPSYEPSESEWAAWEAEFQAAEHPELVVRVAGESEEEFASSDARQEPDLARWTDPQSDPNSPCIIHVPSDPRTFDQLRADLLTDLLLASDPSAVHGDGLADIHATIQVTVAATTLTGDDERPTELDGHGPLLPDAARALAGSTAGWTRLFLDPAGLVTETDTYTPTEPMRRFLRARDQHCRFPGCRMPVHRCDIDHNHDHALGGQTAVDNLAHFCRTHHTLKHPDLPDFARWTARQLPDQTVEWISPAGTSYPDRAPRRVMFVPSGAEPPDTSVSPEPVGAPF